MSEGKHYRSFDKLGAHLRTVGGMTGVHFAVWAPNAEQVDVIGDFNGWTRGATPLQLRHDAGVWEGFVPGVGAGSLYKYRVASRFNGYESERADPYGFGAEIRPQTASEVVDLDAYTWHDETWMVHRGETNWLAVAFEKSIGARFCACSGELLRSSVVAQTRLNHSRRERGRLRQEARAGIWGSMYKARLQ